MINLFRKILLLLIAAVLIVIAGNSLSFGQMVIPANGIGNKTSISLSNGIVEGKVGIKTGLDTAKVRLLYNAFGTPIDTGVMVFQDGNFLIYNGASWTTVTGGGGNADSLVFATIYRDDTGKQRLQIALDDTAANIRASGGSTSDFLNASYTATHGDQEQDFDYTAQIWNRLRAWSVNDTNQLPVIYYGDDINKIYLPITVARSADGVFTQTGFSAANNDSSYNSPLFFMAYASDADHIEKQAYFQSNANNFLTYNWQYNTGIGVSDNEFNIGLGGVVVFLSDSILGKTTIADPSGNTDFTITPNTFTFNGGDIVSGNGLVNISMNTTEPFLALNHPLGAFVNMGVYNDGGLSGGYYTVGGDGARIVADAGYYFFLESQFSTSLYFEWDTANYYERTKSATNLVFGTNSNNALTIGGNTQYISLNATPTYSDDDAAAADTALPTGGLYLITGATGLHQKP